MRRDRGSPPQSPRSRSPGIQEGRRSAAVVPAAEAPAAEERQPGPTFSTLLQYGWSAARLHIWVLHRPEELADESLMKYLMIWYRVLTGFGLLVVVTMTPGFKSLDGSQVFSAFSMTDEMRNMFYVLLLLNAVLYGFIPLTHRNDLQLIHVHLWMDDLAYENGRVHYCKSVLCRLVFGLSTFPLFINCLGQRTLLHLLLFLVGLGMGTYYTYINPYYGPDHTENGAVNQTKNDRFYRDRIIMEMVYGIMVLASVIPTDSPPVAQSIVLWAQQQAREDGLQSLFVNGTVPTPSSGMEPPNDHWGLWLLMVYLHVLRFVAWTKAMVGLLQSRRPENSQPLIELYHRMACIQLPPHNRGR